MPNSNSTGKSIIVVGGGAAGLVAAIAAARLGARVRIVERMSRVGKKILASGNGRCNLANARMDLNSFHGAHRKFIQAVLGRFGFQETLAFFHELGVETRTEPDGRVFPLSDQAACVLDLLRDEAASLGVEEVCDTRIQKVEPRPDGTCVCYGTGDERFIADRVVVAAGGKASPNLGSNGGGYAIAQALGHQVVPPFPSLVQLRLDAPFLKRLDGLKIEGAVQARVDGVARRRAEGEVLFTDYGLSGIAVLEISRVAAQTLEAGGEMELALDLFPRWSAEEVAAILARRFAAHPARPLDTSLVGLLHKRLIGVVIGAAGLDASARRPAREMSGDDTRLLAMQMKDWRMRCTGTQSWMHAQVTAGGVDTREVASDTLESRLAPGVYFAGEVLDVDGDSGGYNLQWAWSSGYVAGTAAATASA